jgi:hypothetical protein
MRECTIGNWQRAVRQQQQCELFCLCGFLLLPQVEHGDVNLGHLIFVMLVGVDEEESQGGDGVLGLLLRGRGVFWFLVGLLLRHVGALLRGRRLIRHGEVQCAMICGVKR